MFEDIITGNGYKVVFEHIKGKIISYLTCFLVLLSCRMMKKTTNFSGVETFVFSPENKLRVFPPNSYKFKPRDHIVLDEVQECLLDNFWYQYNNKREEKGYMLSILNSLAEYFHLINSMLPISNATESVQQRPIYVEFEGPKPGIYVTFEEIISQKMEAKVEGVGMSWKKQK